MLLIFGIILLFVGPLVVAFFVYRFVMKRIKQYEANEAEQERIDVQSNEQLVKRLEQLERRMDQLEKRRRE